LVDVRGKMLSMQAKHHAGSGGRQHHLGGEVVFPSIKKRFS